MDLEFQRDGTLSPNKLMMRKQGSRNRKLRVDIFKCKAQSRERGGNSPRLLIEKHQWLPLARLHYLTLHHPSPPAGDRVSKGLTVGTFLNQTATPKETIEPMYEIGYKQ